MNVSQVAQAIEYKKGHYNLVLWALSNGYNITLWDENNEKRITNSHDYPKISKIMNESYKLEIAIVDPTEKKTNGWAIAYTDNEDEEMLSADFFTAFHNVYKKESINAILNRKTKKGDTTKIKEIIENYAKEKDLPYTDIGMNMLFKIIKQFFFYNFK